MTDDLDRLSHPRASARTRRFTLGAPRAVTLTAAGDVMFVRSTGPTDPVNRLNVLDLSSGDERLLADPGALLSGDDETLSDEERSRRERMRETTSGVTAYDLDAAATTAVFSLSGRLFVVEVDGSTRPRELSVPGPVIDPRMSPDGAWIAWSDGRSLHGVRADGSDHRVLATPSTDTEVWGMADFVAAEEFDRSRGHWWAPDSHALLVESFDDADVPTWWIADPSDPGNPPRQHRYPAAGQANPAVALWIVPVDGGAHVQARIDADQFPYVVTAAWPSTDESGPLVGLLTRDQRRSVVVRVDPGSGATTVVRETVDEAWVETVPGLPALTPDGRLLHLVDDAETDTRRIAVDGVPFSPPGLQVRSVLDVGSHGVIASASEDPTLSRGWFLSYDGGSRLLTDDGEWDVVAAADADRDVVVLARHGLSDTSARWEVRREGAVIGSLPTLAAEPSNRPSPALLRLGDRRIATAVLLPAGHEPGSARLPVVMAPYGGPHHGEVVSVARSFADDQWLADQGFAVVVADGRGTPHRGPAWDRAVRLDFAGPVLDDQVDSLQAAAAAYPDDLDLDRVGITGWSFGGYLSALAVLRRPDVFHAAVAGAPCTDWLLYDTGYTERYLGLPQENPDVYRRSSLIDDAASLRRPLMLIHGLADDNVVPAHTLTLSSALLAAGRPHEVLPLSGVTHMTPQEQVAENLLLLQVDFFRRHLMVGRA